MKKQFRYFSKNQQQGFVVLVIVIIVLQVVLFYLKQRTVDSVINFHTDVAVQKVIDSLKAQAKVKTQLQPFNPNFITDAKGFKLGMSISEIDKLHDFRATGKYVNSAKEFQQITGVSNELLMKISPYFKFPEWTQNKGQKSTLSSQAEKIIKIDINKATKEQLIEIQGIGDYYATAIISEREKINGFISIDQLDFIKHLRPEALQIVKKNVFIGNKPKIVKININKASKEDLEKIPYVTPTIARQILIYRSKQEKPLNVDDLEKINNLPLDKLKIIRLYLDF